MNNLKQGGLSALFILLPFVVFNCFAAEESSNEELYKLYKQLERKLEAYEGRVGAGVKGVPLSGSIDKSYIIAESNDNEFQYKLDGRVMLDFGTVSNSKDENELFSNSEFRRVRLAIKTKMYKNWSGEFDLDFSEGAVELKDLWAAYDGFSSQNLKIKVGHQKPNFSMNEVTTSRWATFMETSMVSDTFAPGRRIGISATNYADRYFFGVSLFGDEAVVNNAEEDRSERYGYSVRAVYRPFAKLEDHKVLHVGLNYMMRKPQSDSGDEIKYSARPESHFIDYKYLNTDTISDVDKIITTGIEVASLWGRFSTQAEYLKSEVEVKSEGSNSSFDGGYGTIAYFITSDYRVYNYSDGEFGAVQPSATNGAWEIALRYSTLDLNDGSAGITGGEATNLTLAVNWYINNNFMMKLNYISVDNDDDADKKGKFVGGDNLNIIGCRLQYLF
ncbi:hypothetical protein A9Q99_04840 [Gammaproteobacteria bacterium 45_16_T64]|nr:hypothetical protein A9Q99_04840 [Gammaproteobacteria bacterium 45_16_T64]